jgi:hypothetical protein
MKLIVRNTHKYLSFFISLQLLIWTVSGIYFAFNKIELVRGEKYFVQESYTMDLSEVDLKLSNVKSLRLLKRLDETIVVASKGLDNSYLDRNGQPVEKLTGNEASLIVARKTSLVPTNVTEITTPKKGSEYRGRALPLYKVLSKDIEENEISVYVNAYSGDIVAIRSSSWRLWDLMWGLHIMDWQERDNINNILLKLFSILALLSSITGLLLFFKMDIKK